MLLNFVSALCYLFQLHNYSSTINSIMMKQVLLLSMLLLVGSCEGRELLRRDNNEMMDAVEMEVEFDYSGQRRELAWGSGFSWFLCK